MGHHDGVDFDAAVAELYDVAPGDFIATRTRLAKENPELAQGLRELRRPTLSAWAVNLLARSAADEVGWLLEVGTQLREAWESGDHIGGLEQRRTELIARLVQVARDVTAEAGQPLRDPAVREVEETLQAATIEPDVAEDVRAGRLAQPRSHAGFGLSGAFAAAPPAAPRPPARRRAAAPRDREEDRRKEREARIARLEDEHRTAADQVAEAQRDLAEWDERADEVQRELAAADSEAEALTRQLDEVKERQAAAGRRLAVMQRERNRATRTADTARRRADEARKKLDRERRKRA
jgi:hypothetical protein